MNQPYSPITRHPKYVYNKDIIEELERFYLKVRLPDSSPFWNLNIQDLRATTKMKQELIYQERFIDELLAIKDAGEEGKRSKVAKRASLMSRRSSQKSIKSKTQTVVRDDSKPFDENLTEELENILLKLQHFTMWYNENKTAFESCYAVMCTAFDVILQEIYQIETDLNIQKIEKYPEQLSYAPHMFEDRLLQIHKDLAGEAPRIEEDFIKGAQPMAECLKNISLEDTTARYQTYYGITAEDPETKGKKEKGKKEKGKKEKKEKKEKKGSKEKSNKSNAKKNKIPEKSNLKKKSDISIEVDLHENPNFNIESQPTIITTSTSSLKQSINEESSEIISDLLLKEYKRSLYDIFYRNLLESIVKLVDVIEIHKQEKLRSDNIKRMIEETTLKEQPIQMRVVNLKEAIRGALNIPTKYNAIYSNISEKTEKISTEFEEPIYAKEEGSQWSILRPPKFPEYPSKPIGYPDTFVYLRRKLGKRLYKDVGTIMSNTCIDPNWMDFKNAGVQVITNIESRPEKEELVSTILDNIVQDICVEKTPATVNGAGKEEINSSLLSTDTMFCCDEIPCSLKTDLEATDEIEDEMA